MNPTNEEPSNPAETNPPTDELLPCPFCGEKPRQEAFILAYIRCDHCRIEMNAYQESMDFLMKKWNTRLAATTPGTSDPSVAAAELSLREQLDQITSWLTAAIRERDTALADIQKCRDLMESSADSPQLPAHVIVDRLLEQVLDHKKRWEDSNFTQVQLRIEKSRATQRAEKAEAQLVALRDSYECACQTEELRKDQLTSYREVARLAREFASECHFYIESKEQADLLAALDKAEEKA